MRIKIPDASEEELYLNAWKMAQADSPWSRYSGPFAPNLKDELDATRAVLHDPTSKCWIAVDDGNVAGVLACRKDNELAWLGSSDREPAVLPDYRQTITGIKLLDTAFEWSIGEGLAGVFAPLKLLPESDPKAQWHVKLYFQWGMTLTRLVVEYGTRIHKTERYANPQVRFKQARDVGLNRLCDIILRSFESTRAFEYDPLVHDPPEVRSSLSEIQNSEGMLVAYLGEEAVGFALVRTPTANDRAYGHIAAIGTLPEHRGKKIGTSLLQKAHNYIIENGYEYSFVGTSENNLPSRALYGKMGYEPVYRILKFVKVTRAINISRDLVSHDFNDLRPLEWPQA